MIFPPLNDLMEKTDSRYSLVIAVAKRARQIAEEESALVTCDSDKPVTLAIHELYENAIQIVDRKDQPVPAQGEPAEQPQSC